jgi:hypothetical protein
VGLAAVGRSAASQARRDGRPAGWAAQGGDGEFGATEQECFGLRVSQGAHGARAPQLRHLSGPQFLDHVRAALIGGRELHPVTRSSPAMAAPVRARVDRHPGESGTANTTRSSPSSSAPHTSHSPRPAPPPPPPRFPPAVHLSGLPPHPPPREPADPRRGPENRPGARARLKSAAGNGGSHRLRPARNTHPAGAAIVRQRMPCA